MISKIGIVIKPFLEYLGYPRDKFGVDIIEKA